MQLIGPINVLANIQLYSMTDGEIENIAENEKKKFLSIIPAIFFLTILIPLAFTVIAIMYYTSFIFLSFLLL